MKFTIKWTPGVTLEQGEQMIILQALEYHSNNKAATARSLGCSVNTIINKLEHYQEMSARLNRDANLEREKEAMFLARQRGQLPPAPHELLEPSLRPGVSSAVSGTRLESSVEDSPVAPVLLPKREEVQSVLPREHAAGRSGRRT